MTLIVCFHRSFFFFSQVAPHDHEQQKKDNTVVGK